MTATVSDYGAFLEKKSQFSGASGFDPVFMPSGLFDFQSFLVDWNLRTGRSASLTDCGAGKSYMELVYAENIVRKTNGRVLLMTPTFCCFDVTERIWSRLKIRSG